MSMTERERVLAVYRHEVPDQVPLMLDLSHWYKANYHTGFDLSGYKEVEQPLVELHKQVGAVCYCEMGASTRSSPIQKPSPSGAIPRMGSLSQRSLHRWVRCMRNVCSVLKAIPTTSASIYCPA